MVQRGAEMKLPNKIIIKAVSGKNSHRFFSIIIKAPAKRAAILRQKNKSPQAILAC